MRLGLYFSYDDYSINTSLSSCDVDNITCGVFIRCEKIEINCYGVTRAKRNLKDCKMDFSILMICIGVLERLVKRDYSVELFCL